MVVLIILIVIMVKACGAGGGTAQPKPHKTRVHKTTAAGVKASASPIDVAVNAVQATQGETVQLDYRINGPAGAMASVKIVVKNQVRQGGGVLHARRATAHQPGPYLPLPGGARPRHILVFGAGEPELRE